MAKVLANAGERPPSQLVVHRSVWDDEMFCASTDYNRIADGVKVHLWRCDRSWQSQGQLVVVDDDGNIRMHARPEYCLAIPSDDRRPGTPIQVKWCDGSDNQKWSVSGNGQVRVMSDWSTSCLVVQSGKLENGKLLELGPCIDAEHVGDGPEEQLRLEGQEWIPFTRIGEWTYATPSNRLVCDYPFQVIDSEDECLAAAEATRPSQSMASQTWIGSCLRRNFPDWDAVIQVHRDPNLPAGCAFGDYSDCHLNFNAQGSAILWPQKNAESICRYIPGEIPAGGR